MKTGDHSRDGAEPRPGVFAMPRGHTLDLRWNALLSEFRRSGLTQAAFCERRGISIHSFRKHLYRLPAPKPSPANPLPCDPAARSFLPVTVLPDPLPATSAARQPLELLLGNGRRIAVTPGFDPHTLRQLIALVEEPTCWTERPVGSTSPKIRPTCGRASTASPHWWQVPRARSPFRSPLRLHQQATRSHQDPVLGPRWPGRLGQEARARLPPSFRLYRNWRTPQ